ncbi:MAG: lysine decarboxylase [Cyanobacteria bacterium K_DeepCast_35m_m2_023]|nr:lysine decarboxylase [Cyanobacteria bacterium K_DeepCast_35m_m2_023]
MGSPLHLHLPAHGRGRALAPALSALLRGRPGSWDLPELPAVGGPLLAEGAVAESQQQVARLLGAERCWFGVNGASGLLQVALLALAPPGSRVLLPRNLHRSLLHACVLGQLEPVLFDLPFEADTGLWQPPPPEHLQRVIAAALAQGPLAAVAVVSPTYQGRKADLMGLAPVAHSAGLPLLVDGAHGLGDGIAAGADLEVLSLQKSAGGLAQSALLLAQGPRVDPAAIERALLWLSSSSPSALLLASCETAIAQLTSSGGARQRQRASSRAARLRQRCSALGLPWLASDDPLRLIVHTGAMGINGLEADAWLLERGVIAELPEPATLTFCLGLAPPAGVERRLPRALLALRQALAGPALPLLERPPLPLLAGLAQPIGSAWRARHERVRLEAAAGRIAAEPLCPYPPGIPLLVPGERIDRERAAWLQRQSRLWPGQIADTVRVVAGDGADA